MANIIQQQANKQEVAAPAKQSVGVMLNAILDSNKMRGRFDELLGKRTAQFLSSLTTLITGDTNLQRAFAESPLTVIAAGLKAATFDLPIDPSLGYAYIVPFQKSVKGADGSWTKVMVAEFIIGYKGMEQLCLRTGLYARIPDAVDVREGELISYDRLTGDAEFRWVEDEDEREQLPVIGYAGYFRLKNGAEKTIYMTTKQIEAHEKKNRKGKDMSKGWREDYDSMARKTIIRRLAGKYGIMSIEYRDNADSKALMAAQQAIEGSDFPDDGNILDAETAPEADPASGEVASNA